VTKNKQLQAALLKFCQSRLAVATMDQVGAAALYSVEQDFYDANRAEYIRRRDLVYDRLKAIDGVIVSKPQGAFYIMAALPVDDTHKFQNWLLTHFEDNGDTVMFAPGAPFYETPGKGKNEVRIAYVLEQEKLSRAMDILAAGISAYRAEVMKVE
jgi:aspartate aminotransferase